MLWSHFYSIGSHNRTSVNEGRMREKKIRTEREDAEETKLHNDAANSQTKEKDKKKNQIEDPEVAQLRGKSLLKPSSEVSAKNGVTCY